MYVKAFYAFLFALFTVRVLAIYTASPHLGPNLEKIRRMLRDVIFFMAIFLIFEVTYGIITESLYQSAIVQCSTNTRAAENYSETAVLSRPYWSMMGALDKELDLFDKLGETSKTCKFAKKWFFPGLLAVYLLISCILLLNLLVALFSQTFEKVDKEAEQLWALSRYDLLVEYQ